MVLEFIQQVWNDRDLEKVENFMIRDLVLHTIGYRTMIRPEGYRRALLRMLRPFPAGQFAVRDVATNYAERYAGLRIAVTWVFSGDYNGAADFGPLTNSGRDPRRLAVPRPDRAGSSARCGSTTRSRCAPRSPAAAATSPSPAPTSTDHQPDQEARS